MPCIALDCLVWASRRVLASRQALARVLALGQSTGVGESSSHGLLVLYWLVMASSLVRAGIQAMDSRLVLPSRQVACVASILAMARTTEKTSVVEKYGPIHTPVQALCNVPYVLKLDLTTCLVLSLPDLASTQATQLHTRSLGSQVAR